MYMAYMVIDWTYTDWPRWAKENWEQSKEKTKKEKLLFASSNAKKKELRKS